MARKLRVEYPGAVYHLMNRGDRREKIFLGDADRVLFLQTLAEVCVKTGWRVHAYCLMANHFHIVAETPRANLVAGMKWFLGTYTNRFNRRHKLSGHLFAGRYKAVIVDGSGNGYLRTVAEYVHLNPHRARILGSERPLKDYPWSSFPAYLLKPKQRPVWLHVDDVFAGMGIPKDSPAGRREFERAMEQRRRAADASEYTRIRRGWFVGDDEFREELLEKVAIAARLRQETTMTIGWIADRLSLGVPSTLNSLLCRRGRVNCKKTRN